MSTIMKSSYAGAKIWYNHNKEENHGYYHKYISTIMLQMYSYQNK